MWCQRPAGTLFVSVLGCRGLLPADSNGLADPFVELSLQVGEGGGAVARRSVNPPVRTRAVPGTLDPTWCVHEQAAACISHIARLDQGLQ